MYYLNCVNVKIRKILDVLVDFVLESHDGLGGSVETAILRDAIVALQNPDSI